MEGSNNRLTTWLCLPARRIFIHFFRVNLFIVKLYKMYLVSGSCTKLGSGILVTVSTSLPRPYLQTVRSGAHRVLQCSSGGFKQQINIRDIRAYVTGVGDMSLPRLNTPPWIHHCPDTYLQILNEQLHHHKQCILVQKGHCLVKVILRSKQGQASPE